MTTLCFLPLPKKVTLGKRIYRLADDCAIGLAPSCTENELLPARHLADALEDAGLLRPPVMRLSKNATAAITLAVNPAVHDPEGYEIQIQPGGVRITGHSGTGVFYAVQTLRQMIRQCGGNLPCGTIQDSPDYPARGFYLDCTRGKVPTRETLLKLVETLGHYKINHFQLYVEHTFAFRQHSDLWAGSDPLTHEDILLLDEHCRKHHIDFVPSLSTFGHMHGMLSCVRKEHLNELDVKASERPFSWFERQSHYTLNPAAPESASLVEGLIDEYAPLFSSPLFNICCDETFDLGKGKSAKAVAKQGAGRVYLKFLKRIMNMVRKRGKTPMFWGDIILKHPECLPDLPKDAVALNWDYSATLARATTGTAAFEASGLRHFACPSCENFVRWRSNHETAWKNITGFASIGKRHNAEGLLNTDWGDMGHNHLFANSYYGLILGAASGWNVRAQLGDKSRKQYEKAFSRLELGDSSGTAVKCLNTPANVIMSWYHLTFLLDPSTETPPPFYDPASKQSQMILKCNARQMLAQWEALSQHRDTLASLRSCNRPRDPLVYAEYAACAWAETLTLATGLLLQKAWRKKTPALPFCAKDVADGWRRFEGEAAQHNVTHRP